MKDRLIIAKITEYVKRVGRIYENIKSLDEMDILERDDSFALTQYLTNIHSLFSNVTSDEIALKQIELGIRALHTCRNISAHDYDALDWSRVKQLCRKLTSENSAALLQKCLEIAMRDEQAMKNYAEDTNEGISRANT